MRTYYKVLIDDAILALQPNAQFVTVDGVITQWHSPDIEQPTDEELQNKLTELKAELPKQIVREMRNKLLAESDWTQTRDNVRLNDSAWITYRQELRDITKSASFNPKLTDKGALDPSSVTWPLKPAT